MLLSNYKEHPTKTNYLIFQYTNHDMAQYFEELLNEKKIDFQVDVSEYGTKNLHLYAVKNSDRKEAIKCNFLAYGKHRKPLINNKFLKTFTLIFFTFLITLAIIGYLNR